MASARSGTKFRAQAVVPLFIKQIISCKQQEFRLHGRSVQIACLVGKLKNIRKVAPTEAALSIEDHSGQINAVLRVETEDELAAKLCTMTDNNTYTQVFGTIRTENSERVFLVFKTRPVDDLNVLTSHALQVMCCKLQAEAELQTQISSANTSGAALADATTSEQMDVTATAPTFTHFQQLIVNIIKSEDSQYGMSKRGILLQFPAYQGHEVNETLRTLINEGHIYPTIDEEHFKAVAHSNF